MKKINKRGFSLVEVIIYISLLSTLMIGVFSSVLSAVYSSMKKPLFLDADYKLLNTNYREGGFIALSLVVSVSALLLAFSFMQSIETAHFFDLTERKEYRLMNYYYAYSCIDQAILNISKDYFYEVSTPIPLNDLNCVIDDVKEQNGLKVIRAHGNYKNMNVKREAKVKLFENRLEVISIE